MSIIKTIKNYAEKLFWDKETDPEAAYDRWSGSYDSQPDNLMLALDEVLFSGFLRETELTNKVIADVGCGTGRHWGKMLDKSPKRLIGFDVSDGMLTVLQKKIPNAETHRLINNALKGLINNSCDIIISTLTIAHIKDAEAALKEWNRVLKPGGSIIITDYHPVALAKGANRTFKHDDKTVAIINYIHPLKKIIAIAKQLDITVLRLEEKCIEESMKPFYEKLNALAIFDAWKGIPIIYGIHLKKKDDTA